MSSASSSFLDEQRKLRSWFPEHLPGMYVLTKSEITDDIRMVQANVDDVYAGDEGEQAHKDSDPREETKSGRGRKGKSRRRGRASKESDAKTNERPSKRRRMYAKLLPVMQRRSKLHTHHVALRQELDSMRGEISQHRDMIQQCRRSMTVQREEKAILARAFHRNYWELNAKFETMAQSRDDYVRRLNELKEKLDREVSKVQVAGEQLTQMQLCDKELQIRAFRIRQLEALLKTERETSQRLLTVLKNTRGRYAGAGVAVDGSSGAANDESGAVGGVSEPVQEQKQPEAVEGPLKAEIASVLPTSSMGNAPVKQEPGLADVQMPFEPPAPPPVPSPPSGEQSSAVKEQDEASSTAAPSQQNADGASSDVQQSGVKTDEPDSSKSDAPNGVVAMQSSPTSQQPAAEEPSAQADSSTSVGGSSSSAGDEWSPPKVPGELVPVFRDVLPGYLALQHDIVSELRYDIVSLKQEIEQSQSAFESRETLIASLCSDVDAKKAEVRAERERAEELRAQVDRLKAQLVQAELHADKQAVDKKKQARVIAAHEDLRLAREEVLAMASERSTAAMEGLRRVARESALLRHTNRQLQQRYNELSTLYEVCESERNILASECNDALVKMQALKERELQALNAYRKQHVQSQLLEHRVEAHRLELEQLRNSKSESGSKEHDASNDNDNDNQDGENKDAETPLDEPVPTPTPPPVPKETRARRRSRGRPRRS